MSSSDTLLQELLELPTTMQPVVSPDGRYIAWTWLNYKGAGEVYIASLNADKTPIQVTATGQKTWVNSWLPDSSGLIVAHDIDGDELDQLFTVSIAAPKKLTPLTEKPVDYYIRGGELHPDGNRLIYSANYDYETKQTLSANWVYVHDLETNVRRPIAKPTAPFWCIPRLNKSGEYVAYQRNIENSSGGEIWLAAIDGSKDECELSWGPEYNSSYRWSADGNSIIFVAYNGDSTRLGIWSLATRKTTWLINDPARNLYFAWPALFDNAIFYTETNDAKNRTKLLELETGKETSFATKHGTFEPLTQMQDGRWVGNYYSATNLSEIAIYDLKSQSILPLASRHHVSQPLVEARDYRWKSADGLGIQGCYTKQSNQSKALSCMFMMVQLVIAKRRLISQFSIFVLRASTCWM